MERFNRSLNKILKQAISDGDCWQRALLRFLAAYRSSPHSATQVPPAQRMFRYNFRDKVRASLPRHKHRFVGEEEGAKLKVGDLVLVKNLRKGKGQTYWLPNACKVENVKGTTVSIHSQSGHKLLRHASHVKLINETHRGKEHAGLDDSCSSDDGASVIEDTPVASSQYNESTTRHTATRYPARRRQAPDIFQAGFP